MKVEHSEGNIIEKTDTNQYVVDYCIVNDDKADKAKAKCPVGYRLIDRDLNAGSGGDYIYLCYKTDSVGVPIREMFIVNQKVKLTVDKNTKVATMKTYHTQQHYGETYTFICKMAHDANERDKEKDYAADLNNKTGGGPDSIYLWSSTETRESPIKDIRVVTRRAKEDFPKFPNWCYVTRHQTTEPADCNESAEGEYIYLMLER